MFLDKQANLTNNDGYISERTTFNRIRILLILTSGICTLIFSFYSLHNPEYEKQLTEKTQVLKNDYTQQLEQIDTEFDKRMAGINAEVEMWRRRLDVEAQRVINGISEGPRYKAYEKQYNQAVENRDKQRRQHESDRLQQITELTQAHEQKLKNITEALKNSRNCPEQNVICYFTSVTNNDGYISERSTFNRIRILLILTSGICTLCHFHVNGQVNSRH